ncbi:hypothetical protein SAMN05428949_3473 [Chitinophaga sp. YR627]|nr:hypothetical protein SAMN05428949_3473 [Chitinophaga sp. YR627]
MSGFENNPSLSFPYVLSNQLALLRPLCNNQSFSFYQRNGLSSPVDNNLLFIFSQHDKFHN